MSTTDAGEVVLPLVVFGVAVAVIVTTVLVRRSEARAADPGEVLRAAGPLGAWRADHGPAVDAWFEGCEERFAGDRGAVVEPMPWELEERFVAAARACPDESLGAALLEVQDAAQAALVAIVAGEERVADAQQQRYVDARTTAVERFLEAWAEVARGGRDLQST